MVWKVVLVIPTRIPDSTRMIMPKPLNKHIQVDAFSDCDSDSIRSAAVKKKAVDVESVLPLPRSSQISDDKIHVNGSVKVDASGEITKEIRVADGLAVRRKALAKMAADMEKYKREGGAKQKKHKKQMMKKKKQQQNNLDTKDKLVDLYNDNVLTRALGRAMNMNMKVSCIDARSTVQDVVASYDRKKENLNREISQINAKSRRCVLTRNELDAVKRFAKDKHLVPLIFTSILMVWKSC